MWTFSFCSNARSFDRPTVAKPGEKIKVPIFIRRKGADAFRPALVAGGSLMAYKCRSLCRFRGFTAGFCKNFVQRFQKFKVRFQGKAKNFDLFRMRKKFRVQVERNFPTLSHERFSIVEPVVQFPMRSGLGWTARLRSAFSCKAASTSPFLKLVTDAVRPDELCSSGR